MNKLLRVIFALMVLLGALANVSSSASAQEETVKTVYCIGGPCVVIDHVTLAEIEANASFWGTYASYGDTTYKVSSTWETAANPSHWWEGWDNPNLPSKVILDGSYLSVAQMGIFMHEGVLRYRKPGYLIAGEMPTPFPSNKGYSEIMWTDIPDFDPENPKLITSYSWNGRVMLTWEFVPEFVLGQLTLHIYTLRIGIFETEQIPSGIDITYDTVHLINWVPGERLVVVEEFIDVFYIKPTYTQTWEDDLQWLYEEEIEYLAKSMPYEVAVEYVKLAHADVVDEVVGTFPNYLDTNWRTAYVWTDGYRIRRTNGQEFLLDAEQLMHSKICGGNICTGRAQSGNLLYIDGSTFTMWKPGDNPGLFNLRTTSVPIKQPLHREDKSLIQQREARGELIKVTGVVTVPYNIDWDNDGEEDQVFIGFQPDSNQEYDKPYIELTARWTPPIGTRVIVWIYRESASPKYKGLGWSVMSVTDRSLYYTWFFNQESEFGYQYNPLRYSIDACGGLMTIDNWLNGCQK